MLIEDLEDVTLAVEERLLRALKPLRGKVPAIAVFIALLRLAKRIIIRNEIGLSDLEMWILSQATNQLHQDVEDLLEKTEDG